MKIEIQSHWYTTEDCMNNLDKLYVFGDNLLRVGNGGQAQIRPLENSIGVATKRSPSMSNDSFFNDDFEDLYEMIRDLLSLKRRVEHPGYANKTLVFPADGLGTGLSQLPKRSPFVNYQLSLLLNQYFGIETDPDGKLSLIGDK